MPDDYKSLEGKQVTVFWSDNREEIKTVDRVNGKFVLFAGEKDWVSMHRIDGMEAVGEVEIDLNQGLEFPFPPVAEFKHKPKRICRPYKKPRAYQRHNEGGIWYVHHGNGKGFNVKGQGGTLEEAYYDWKVKHTEKQGQRK